MWPVIIVVSILLLLEVTAILLERYSWNNGICRKSGQPWVYFDTDSHGCLGYKDEQGNCTWVSYSWITKGR